MQSRISSLFFIGIVGAVVAMPVAAADPTPSKRSGYDPNERICENIILTGSRLAMKRFCATRAEWAERRQLDRDAVEAAQRSPCVIQRNTNNGPSC
jgi:hypothetical protein